MASYREIRNLALTTRREDMHGPAEIKRANREATEGGKPYRTALAAVRSLLLEAKGARDTCCVSTVADEALAEALSIATATLEAT